MSEQSKENKNMNEEKNDNLSQQEAIDDVLSNFLNTDDSRAGTEIIDEGMDEERDKLLAEIAELKDKNLRQLAEFENFRRRQAKERNELQHTAGKDVIQSLLVALDDVDRAEKQLETTTDIAVVKEGISLVFAKLRSIMHQKGLTKMEAINEEFNPDLHEAITEIPVTSDDMRGKVVDVLESGYYLNDRLIRFAKVIVGK